METVNSLPEETQSEDVNGANNVGLKKGLVVVGLLAGVIGIATVTLANMNKEVQEGNEKKPMRLSTTLPEPEINIDWTVVQPKVEAEVKQAIDVKSHEPPPRERRVAVARVSRPKYSAPPKPDIDKSLSGAVIPVQEGTSVQVAQAGSMPVTDAGNDMFDKPMSKSSPGVQHGDPYTSTKLKGSSATLLNDAGSMLMPGQSVDCTLQNDIESTHAGIAVCRTARDIYSTDGQNVLIYANSIVTGEYNTMTIRGANSLALIWSTVQTWNSEGEQVIANLDSPGAGPMGSTGIKSEVDRHYRQRFAGAILVSILGDVGSAMAKGDSNADVVIGGAAQTTSQLAIRMLDDSIGIADTHTVRAGARVKIMVTRPVSFAGVLG